MRLLATALVFTFTAGVLAAQPTFGLKAGLNVATMSGFDDFEDDDSIDKVPRLGGIGGAWVHYGFGPSVGVQAEVLFSQKGVR
ncbi:MAG: outer membrane beta-barrel protein, partial [Bacteroidota bacterium]